MKRVPLIPTLIVAAAVATMIALGVWQLSRAREKEALLLRYEAAANLPAVNWPSIPPADNKLPLFRKASAMCLQPVASKVIAGRNAQGESGYSHLVDCRTGAEGPGVRVDIGWSKDPRAGAQWKGGPVSGVIAPDSEHRMRLISATGLADLQASAPPSPADIPNNHRSYAMQWFLFAAAALIIYGLALRGRLAKAPE
ncbi:SURF1 family protein [Sphingomonas arenae]|uniref:SURF1 family protein n=1 Tax=Sphingomonas arenae TaxID=2812555 RepID=UPI0019684244|nr:SURF1 family protein [Sphingomonas arenae]